jgi:hypothetical protein
MIRTLNQESNPKNKEQKFAEKIRSLETITTTFEHLSLFLSYLRFPSLLLAFLHFCSLNLQTIQALNQKSNPKQPEQAARK